MKKQKNFVDIYRYMNVKKDECYTTFAEAEKIVKFLIYKKIIKKSTKVWLPFDNEISNIYKALKGHCEIILSNLEIGLDFYNYKPKDWDMILTNPPFSNRTNLMKRLVSFNKPFVILQATQYFNNQHAVNMLSEFNNDFQFILPRTRMSFLTYKKETDRVESSKNGASFYSFWLCFKINLEQTFNKLLDSGKEKITEKWDMQGNVITDNHFNIFNLIKKENSIETENNN